MRFVILRGCEEILSEGGAEGRERRIFGYTGSTLPTERRRNHRPRCATDRTLCAIGPSPAGVTEDPSLRPLGPTPLRISSQPLSGFEEILSEGGSEGWERSIFGYTGSTLPTERRRNHGPRCATNRTACASGSRPAGMTEDPSLPPLGPTPLRISSQPLSEAKDLRRHIPRSFAVSAAQDDV